MRSKLLVIIAVVCVQLEVQCALVRRISCPGVRLKNGRVRYRHKSGFVQFQCNKSYLLAGEKYMKCIHGKWEGDVPVCVKNTCKPSKEPTNGFVYPSHRGAVLNFFCKAGYELRGNAVAYCDGDTWSSYLPSCIVATKNVSMNCTFEDEDMCGWSHDINHDFDWTRMKLKTPSGHIGTGPSHDHTPGAHGEGYYMYIEATSRNLNDTARLISPAYEKQDDAACLVFWYHMYGQEVGGLRVYVKKVGDPWVSPLRDPVFERAGDQGDRWRRGLVNLGPIDDEFQVVMEGVRGGNYLSDIAIDDVSIVEHCAETDLEESTSVSSSSATEDGYYEYGSCQDRCHHRGTETITCDCHDTCMLFSSCCPDYIAICILGDVGDADFTDIYLSNETFTDAAEPTSAEPSRAVHVTSSPMPTYVNDSNEVPLHTFNKSEIFVTKMPEWTTRSSTTPALVVTTTRAPDSRTTRKLTTPARRGLTEIRRLTTLTRRLTTPIRRLTTPIRRLTTTMTIRSARNATVAAVQQKISPATYNWRFRAPKAGKATAPLEKRPTLRLHVFNKTERFWRRRTTYSKENDIFMVHHLQTTEAVESTSVEAHRATTAAAPQLLGALEKPPPAKGGIGAGGLTLAVAGAALLATGALVGLLAARRRHSCLRLRRRMRNGPHGDSQSDVRFLTSDEVLDFTLAIPE